LFRFIGGRGERAKLIDRGRESLSVSDWRRRSVGGIRGATENEFSNGRYGTGAVFARRRIVQYSMGIQISRAGRPAVFRRDPDVETGLSNC